MVDAPSELQWRAAQARKDTIFLTDVGVGSLTPDVKYH